MVPRRKPPAVRRQAAVIPYRRGEHGLEVLLITSRAQRRWIVPKGFVESDHTAREVAAFEAFEEAGIRGAVEAPALGAFLYEKSGPDRQPLYTCRVEVFPMAVAEELADWPERAERSRRWMPLAEAAGSVDDLPLAELIRRLEDALGRRRDGHAL